jgi:hypothetical protein
MTIIPVVEFAPDQPDLPTAASDTVYNVIPATAQSYGPMQAHQSFSSALTARCQGGLTASDFNGNARVYAGDASKLYRIASPGTTAADVSKSGGYVTGSTQPWSFSILGQRVIATNGNDPIQGYLEGTSTLFGDLITSGVTSLKARYTAVIKNFLFLGYTADSTYGTQPQRTWWSAINDPTNFPTPGTQLAANNLSDFQDVPGGHGAIQGIAGNLGTADGATFFERAVWRIIYSGLPNVFDFVPAEGARGLFVSGGLCQFGAEVFYPTEDGFYRFDGSNSTPIGKQKVDRFFYNDLQTDYLDRVSSAVDPSKGLIYWAYPGAGSTNGNPNRLLVYSPSFDRWAATELGTVEIEYILRGATFGKTLEQLDSYGTIETLPVSLDSKVWAGNRSLLAAFDTSHQYGYFDGANLAAKIDTTDIEIAPGWQSKVTRARPLVDSSASTLAISSRDRLSQTNSFSSDQVQEPNGSCSLNSRGRYHRLRFKTASGESWNHFSGVDIEEFEALGTR